MSRLAVLTGGTGFIGRAVVLALATAGWRVRLLVRSKPDHPQLFACPFETVPGDIGSPKALRDLVSGADAIIHAGGLVKAALNRDFTRVNAEGTANLAQAAAELAPDARLVMISSMAAREPQLSPYATSKRQGEIALQTSLPGGNWAIVRPPAVYGPWDAEFLPVFRALKAPLFPLFAPSSARLALIHVEDMAQAVLALCTGGPSQSIMEVSDPRPEGYSWRELLEEPAAILGTRPRFLPLPGGFLMAAGVINEGLGRLRGRAMMFTPAKAREMLHPDWTTNTSRWPAAELWRPRITWREGVHSTFEWYKAMDWL